MSRGSFERDQTKPVMPLRGLPKIAWGCPRQARWAQRGARIRHLRWHPWRSRRRTLWGARRTQGMLGNPPLPPRYHCRARAAKHPTTASIVRLLGHQAPSSLALRKNVHINSRARTTRFCSSSSIAKPPRPRARRLLVLYDERACRSLERPLSVRSLYTALAAQPSFDILMSLCGMRTALSS